MSLPALALLGMFPVVSEPREEFVLEVAVVIHHIHPEAFEVFLRALAREWVSELVVPGRGRNLPAHRVPTAEVIEWAGRVH